jgi:hypothetical protein
MDHFYRSAVEHSSALLASHSSAVVTLLVDMLSLAWNFNDMQLKSATNDAESYSIDHPKKKS